MPFEEKKEPIPKKIEEETKAKLTPRVLDAEIGMLSYGDDSLRDEPIFLKMWPKQPIQGIKLHIDVEKKRLYLRFTQDYDQHSILMKFSQTVEAYLFSDDHGHQYLVLKLKRPPRISTLEENKYTQKSEYFRAPSFLKEENEFINFYLLNPVVVMRIQFNSRTDREEFKKEVFQRLKHPMLEMPFDPKNPLATQLIQDLVGEGEKGETMSAVLQRLST